MAPSTLCPKTATRWPFVLRNLLLITFIAALTAFSAYQNLLHYEQQARVSADNLSQVLGNHIGSAIEKIDLVLKTVVRDVLQLQSRGRVDQNDLELLLAQQQQLLPDAKDLLIADAEGVFRYGTNVPPGFRIDISDLDYFKRARDDPMAGLVISGPYQSRVDEKWVMVFARRIYRPDGSFAGIVASTISADHFKEMLSSLNLGTHSSVVLRTEAMSEVARFPPLPDADVLGNQAISGEFRDRLRAEPSHGSFVADSPFDSIKRIHAYRKVSGFPLYVVVGLASADYWAPWWTDVIQLAGLIAIFSVITLWLSWIAKRAAEKQQAVSQLLEEAVDSVAVGFSIFDPQDRLVICNGATREFFGGGREMLVPGARFEDIVRAEITQDKSSHVCDNADEWLAKRIRLHQAADGKPTEMEFRNGRQVLIIERRTDSGHIVTNWVDITELAQYRDQLEGFVFAASHDLRGPLGRINSFSALLERKFRDRLEGEGIQFLDFIRENATRLLNLIDDLLDHALIHQKTGELQPIDLLAAVQSALQEKAEDVRETGAVIQLHLQPMLVLADRYGLSQVLHNLLENAFKYSAGIARPIIEIDAEEREGHVRLWVRDNGIGFDMEYHDKIFEIFRRLHNYADYAGSGVGLALVKRAMDRMGGKVWAESEPGRGATFFLEFQGAGQQVDPRG